MAFCAASGVSRATLVVASASFACATATCALACVDRRLVLPRIEFEQKLALLDEVAVLIILFQQVSLHLGRDVGVHRAVELRHPLLKDWNVLLRNLGDQHLGRTRLRLFFLLLATDQQRPGSKDNAEENRS